MDPHTTRRRVNDAFLRDLLADWQQHGAEVIRQVAREQPGTYMKVMAMLMPRETKIETTQSIIGGMSDEQLGAMLHTLQEQIAAKPRRSEQGHQWGSHGGGGIARAVEAMATSAHAQSSQGA